MRIPRLKPILFALFAMLASVNALAYDFFQDGLCFKMTACESGSGVEVTHSIRFDGTSYINPVVNDRLEIPTEVFGEYGGKYRVVAIGESALSFTSHNWLSFSSVTIPNSVIRINDNAFFGRDDLKSISVPNSVTSIGKDAFSCTGLKSITLPNSVTSIGNSAFSVCKYLAAVSLPNSLSEIPAGAFASCSRLESVNIPNSVTYIGSNAFRDCTSLTSVTIPDAVTYIGERTFGGCTSLTSVTIPNSVTQINEQTFRDCTSLTSVTIPNSVNRLWKESFYGCVGLTDIYCYATIPPKMEYNSFSCKTYDNCTLHVPLGCWRAYVKSGTWGQFRKTEEMDFSGINEMETDDDQFQITVQNGTLVINDSIGNAIVNVSDMQGRVVYNGYEREISGLARGLYIVRIGNLTTKIVI